MIICEDCNKEAILYASLSEPLPNRMCQLFRYWRCPECKTKYVEVLKPKSLDDHTSAEVIEIKKYPIKKPKEYTLDNWF